MATATQAQIDSGDQIIVGVNKYQPAATGSIAEEVQVRRIDNRDVRAQQIASLKKSGLSVIRRVGAALEALGAAAAGNEKFDARAIEAACAGYGWRDVRRACHAFRPSPVAINGVRGVWKRHMHGVRDIEISRTGLSPLLRQLAGHPDPGRQTRSGWA